MRTADDLYQNRIKLRVTMIEREIFGKMQGS
jgi:hypothetical protein